MVDSALPENWTTFVDDDEWRDDVAGVLAPVFDDPIDTDCVEAVEDSCLCDAYGSFNAELPRVDD